MTLKHKPVADLIGDTQQTTPRILIVGAGMAGLTLAALLQQRGVRPTLVERGGDPASKGYMLGLFPLGGRVLHGLGAHDAYLASSQPMNSYEFRDGRGRLLKRYELGAFIRQYGAYQGVTRGALAQCLIAAMVAPEAALGTTVSDLAQDEDGVDVTFCDGTQGRFDLVVGADGANSAIRAMILGPGDLDHFDTGWGGWVAWTDPARQAADTYTECSGPGYFAGLYPVKDAVAGFLGGRRDWLQRLGREGFADYLAQRFDAGQARAEALIAAVKAAESPYFWPLADCRSKRWRQGRVVLLGDAAASFLPTAGVGASMAMDAAAALNDELTRTDSAHVPYALRLFEARQRPRTAAAQKNSRQLARLMMVNSRPTAWLRDRAMRFYSLRAVLRDISALMEPGGQAARRAG